MSTFIELIISGLSIGFVYALVALGFVMIYRAGHVFNIAHGSMLVLVGLVTAFLSVHLGFWGALVGGVLAAVVLWLAVYFILSLARPQTGAIALTVATLGIDVVLLAEINRQVGSDRRIIEGTPWGNNVVEIMGIVLPESRLWAAGTAIIVILLLFLAIRRTRWGISMRAVAEDAETASLMGIRLGPVRASAWVVAGVLAVLAVLFLTSYPTPGISVYTPMIALTALPAVIIGGLDSPEGAILGGLIVGVTQNLAVGYQSLMPFLGDGFPGLVPYLAMLVVLLIRPAGLLGSKELTRV